jgi:hypothetical protein
MVRTSRGTLPALVAASVLAGSACGKTESDAGQPAGGGTAGTAGSQATAGASATTGGGNGGSAGTLFIPPIEAGPGTGGAKQYPDYCLSDYIVDIPEEGVPAEPGQICSASVGPVDSNRAARVELVAQPGDLLQAAGTIEVAAAVRAYLVGTPIVEVIDASDPKLTSIQVTNLTASATGYTFDASWPEAAQWQDDVTRMTVRVTLEIDCDGSQMTVHAVTDVHLCIDDDALQWVSSGDTCTVCRVIAEMAPSPIVPDKHGDDLPLAQALRLRVVELARVSNTVVLLAENDGGEGLEYEWHPSVGKVERLAPDIVAWTLEEGMPSPMIQAAVWSADAAAVASFSFNEEAA